MFKDYQEEVIKQIAASNRKVKERLIQTLVDEELAKREATAIKAFKKLSTLKASLDDESVSGPDQTIFGEDGKPTGKGFSKERLAARNKLQKEASSLEEALTKALTEGDFTTLNKLTS